MQRLPVVGIQSPFLDPAVNERLLALEDISEQVWETERRKAGKRPWQWIEFEVDRCRHTSGQAPCTATQTGDEKCINSWETCNDPANYDARPYWIRCAEGVADMPRTFEFADEGLAAFLPLLGKVDHSPMVPNPGESLGKRATLTVSLQDAPHHDIGIDKYVGERTYVAQQRSTFFRKLRARFPHYIGRRLRWYQGYITAEPSYADFRRREYVMEKIEWPDGRGRLKVVAKDLLKLLDDERAQCPRKSGGKLMVAIAAAGPVTTIDVETADATEYDLEAGETADYVRIGDEGFTYTGTTVITNGVRLTGVTRDLPDDYTTEQSAHDIGDQVQRCRYLQGTIPEVAEELMVDFGGIDPAYIPKAEWDLEADTWLADENIARLVTEPEGVRKLIDQIVSQTMTWGFWFDEIEQKMRFRCMRPVDIDENVPELADGAHLVADSVRVIDEPDRVVNEVQVLYGEIDPTKNGDEINNYRRGIIVVDAASQSTNELNQQRVKKVFARWHPVRNASVVTRFASRTLAARAQNLAAVEFKVERKDESLRTAQFADLTTMYLIDALGAPITTRVQVMRTEASDDLVTYRAREDFFKARYFGRWAPEALEGLAWADATDEQKERYLFWAQADGTFTNGDAGKGWT